MIFVTDGLLRKSVVVCQSLGRQGVGGTVGGTTRLAPGFFYRYARERMIYPSPVTEPDAFVSTLLDYLRRKPHDVLLPTDDATLALIAHHREAFEAVTHVPIPDSGRLVYGLDKARLMLLAQHL